VKKSTKVEKKMKSLKLCKETLSLLNSPELRHVMGADGETSRTVPNSGCCLW